MLRHCSLRSLQKTSEVYSCLSHGPVSLLYQNQCQFSEVDSRSLASITPVLICLLKNYLFIFFPLTSYCAYRDRTPTALLERWAQCVILEGLWYTIRINNLGNVWKGFCPSLISTEQTYFFIICNWVVIYMYMCVCAHKKVLFACSTACYWKYEFSIPYSTISHSEILVAFKWKS